MPGASGRKRAVVAAAAMIVAVIPGASAMGVEKPSVAGYLTDFAASHRVPGAAVGVIDTDGSVALERSTGHDGDGRPVDRDTRFLVGSVAKSMTATSVMLRVHRGEVRTGDRIGDHLPWLADAQPTVQQLLTHTSGYSSADGLAVAERYDNSPGAIRRAAEDLDHSGRLGAYEYSDANYLVLGALLERLSGRSFADTLRTDLFAPLGMQSSGAGAGDAADLPPGHRYWWGHPRTYSPGFDESGGPFGYVVSTLGDLERYARAQAGHFPDVLAPSLLSELHAARVRAGDDDYGYGWRVSRGPAPQTVAHTGATPGYFAHVVLISGGRSVVVLMNAYSEANAPALASFAPRVARILDGESVATTSGDPLLTAAPWMAAALAGLGALAVGLAWWRPQGRRRRVGLAAVGVAVSVLACVVPFALGSSYRTLSIWAPDLAVGLVATVALWVAATVLLIIRRGHRPI